MSVVRIESVETPLDDPAVALLGARLLSRAEAMGLLGSKPVRTLDRDALRRVLKELATTGVARDALVRFDTQPPEPRALADLLRDLLAAVEESPLPEREWEPMVDTLGAELLARLLGIGASSLRRYASGERSTPDEVADRLHFIALVVADLAGAYNAMGIRRWFVRPRPQLDGKAPIALLDRRWTSDSPGADRVRALAAGLLGAPAT